MLDDLSANQNKLIADVMKSHGYDELTRTQEQAFTDGILSGGNNLLVAETGNGKTLCAEVLTKKHLEQNGKVAYLVPSRQLVRDKRDTIREWADGYRVSSGNQKYYNADVAVATFASFYRAILQDIGDARNFDLVVLDDFHEIYGSFLGPEIEKSVAAILSEEIEIFAMSATIGNPVSVGDWMNADVTVSDEERQISIYEESYEFSGSKKDKLVSLIQEKRERAPFLIFNFARSWAESRAEAIADAGVFDDQNELTKSDVVDSMEGKIGNELSSSLENLAWMVSNGVAYHHSSVPRAIRQYIEDLYYEGKIQCLSATTTIAYGFDAPVRSVVVADIKRQSNWVGVWEYQQWIGRAARPGYGYEEGYAYTLTRNPDEVQEKYFEPRVLEPVSTHIDDDSRFRKFIIELIETGWNTPEKIQSFAHETLYWQQLVTEGSWGDEEMANELLDDKIRSTAKWLSRNTLIKEKPSKRVFDTTERGHGAVQFLFDTFGSATLSQITEFYSWVENANDITTFNLLEAVCDIFDITISNTSPSSQLQQRIQSNGFGVTDASVTAAVIDWYWVENTKTDIIEEETDIDTTYLYTVTSKVSDTLDSIEHLFDGLSLRPPNWLGIYTRRVERGVRRDELPLVDNVRNIGRYRVRKLRNYLTDNTVPAIDRLPDDASLGELLYGLYVDTDSESQFKDVLRGQIPGIGPKTASSILEYVKSNSQQFSTEPIESLNTDTTTDNGEYTQKQSDTTNQPDINEDDKSDSEASGSTETTLDEWT